MTLPMLVKAAQERVDAYPEIAERFFQEVFGVSRDAVLYTDMSSLSDFRGLGELCVSEYEEDMDYAVYCKKWNELMLNRVEERLGVRPRSEFVLLHDLFREIEEFQKSKANLH